MTFIAYPYDPDSNALLGGKGCALARLGEAGFRIPAWFAVVPQACGTGFEVKPEARTEIADAMEALCPGGERVAVRSSALEEDSPENSFAGQLDSFLSVPPAAVLEKICDVWKSGYSERVVAYRRERGLPGTPQTPAVIVQRMVQPETAGVAFGADPVSGRRGVVVVAAVAGLGDALVSGRNDADTWHVNRENEIIFRENKAGVLTDTQVREVAGLARLAGRIFRSPQDIEWAFEDGVLYLLQSRPITSLKTMADPDGVFNLWDNSNIAESYSGVTTPLTFTFARYIYEGVYRQFCKIMRVSAVKIEANHDTFRRMLGMVRGRVYYNLLSWYRVLSLLPGYTVNRRFMEQMMGVKKSVPAEWVGATVTAGAVEKMRDAVHLGISVVGLLANHFLLPHKTKKFYARLNEALAQRGPALEEMRPDELCQAFRDLERRLLTQWDAPLINDFFAMIFYGLLRKLADTWCGGSGQSLQNDLLCGEGGIISAEPARMVRQMAELAAGNPVLVDVLCGGSLTEIRKALAGMPVLETCYHDYLKTFGDRCLQELKLESPTLHDDPLPLLRSIGQFARRISQNTAHIAAEKQQRKKAEELAAHCLRAHPLRRLLFAWVLKNARARVRDRENLRFERTRLFGRVRRIFVELGHRYFDLGLIHAPRDIFYLTIDEATGVTDGTSVASDLKGLIAVRQAEFERFRNEPVPPDRFETRGPVIHGQMFYVKRPTTYKESTESLRGSACCPGIVRGPVRVVCDPRNAVIRPGEILVAERTDPGWIMLFPAAAGLLVEYGSLLSHSAIVAREMGLPAIVSVSGLTHWLRDDDWVEMDGGTGVIRKIQPEPGYGK